MAPRSSIPRWTSMWRYTPRRSSRSRPASLTSCSEPTGSASRAIAIGPNSNDRSGGTVASVAAEELQQHDRFRIDQLVRPIVTLSGAARRGGGVLPGPPVAFIRQKRMAFREDIRFFADESEAQELFRIKARRVIDIGGRCDVHDANGQPIGVLEHQFRKSLLRSTWRILSPADEELAVAKEKNAFLAIARRVVDFVPYGEGVPIPGSGSRSASRSTRCRTGEQGPELAPGGAAQDPRGLGRRLSRLRLGAALLRGVRGRAAGAVPSVRRGAPLPVPELRRAVLVGVRGRVRVVRRRAAPTGAVRRADPEGLAPDLGEADQRHDLVVADLAVVELAQEASHLLRAADLRVVVFDLAR